MIRDSAIVPLRVILIAFCSLLVGRATPVLAQGPPVAATWNGTPLHSDGPSLITPSGPPVGGTALAISNWTGLYRIGLPIWVRVEVRNLTPAYISLPDINPRSWDVEVTNLQTGQKFEGTSLVWLDAFSGGFGGFYIQRGQSHFAAIRIDRLFNVTAPGRYAIRVALTPGAQATSVQPTTVVALHSNPLTIDVLPAWSGNALARSPTVRENAQSQEPAGASSHGFALSLKPDWPKPNPGDPLNVSVELRNVSGAPQSVDFGSRRADYDFQIVSAANGSVVPRNPKADFSSDPKQPAATNRQVYPDTSVYSTFSLNSLYNFSQRGAYSVRLVGRPTINGKQITLTSNTVELTYVPPPVTTPLPAGKRVLDYAIETDRTVYTVGQPIFVRLIVTNVTNTPVAYSLDGPMPPCVLTITNDRGEQVPSTQEGMGSTIGRGTIGMPRLPIGPTPFPWRSLAFWGYRIDQPGVYVIRAKSNISGRIFTDAAIYPVDGSNASYAAPLTIRVISREAAREIPAVNLNDPEAESAIRPVVDDYRRLRSMLWSGVDQLQRGVAYPPAIPSSDDWAQKQNQLERRASDLPIPADRNPSYVLVRGNLIAALAELRDAGTCTVIWRNVADARAALQLSDYFWDAVERELSNGEARVNDTAYPPEPVLRSYCRHLYWG